MTRKPTTEPEDTFVLVDKEDDEDEGFVLTPEEQAKDIKQLMSKLQVQTPPSDTPSRDDTVRVGGMAMVVVMIAIFMQRFLCSGYEHFEVRAEEPSAPHVPAPAFAPTLVVAPPPELRPEPIPVKFSRNSVLIPTNQTQPDQYKPVPMPRQHEGVVAPYSPLHVPVVPPKINLPAVPPKILPIHTAAHDRVLVPSVRPIVTVDRLHSERSFRDYVDRHHNVFVLFVSPGSVEYHGVQTIWQEFATRIVMENINLKVAFVDCDTTQALCEEQHVTGPLNLRFFNHKHIYHYPESSFDPKALMAFVEVSVKKEAESHSLPPPKPYHRPREQPSTGSVALSHYSYEGFLQQNENVFVVFFRPCRAYQERFVPVWNDFARLVERDNLSVKLGTVDCTSHPSLCRMNEIDSFPTMRWFQDEIPLSDFYHKRTPRKLLKFAKVMLGDFDFNEMEQQDETYEGIKI